MNFSKTAAQPPFNILLLEDDDGDAMALERAFHRAKIGNPMVRAVDGIEGLEVLRGANARPAVPSPRILLVDLNMPRMGGIQFVQALRGDIDLRQSIVFILTTSKRDEDKAAAYTLNVAGYIAKATAAEDFLNLVSLLEYYGRIVELP